MMDLEAIFAGYVEKVYPAGIPGNQYKELRLAFVAGLHFSNQFHKGIGGLPEERALELLAGFHTQVELFGRAPEPGNN